MLTLCLEIVVPFNTQKSKVSGMVFLLTLQMYKLFFSVNSCNIKFTKWNIPEKVYILTKIDALYRWFQGLFQKVRACVQFFRKMAKKRQKKLKKRAKYVKLWAKIGSYSCGSWDSLVLNHCFIAIYHHLSSYAVYSQSLTSILQ